MNDSANTILILGIGNVGVEYDGTRHNVGFDIIDAFVRRRTNAVAKSFCYSAVTECHFGEKRIIVAKPNTYVNLSGKASQEVLDFYALSSEQMIVVVDDFHLLLGAIRFRSKGSAGGHNGLKSLIEHSTGMFHRLRFGIGPLPEGDSIVDFVLGMFLEEERNSIVERITLAAQALEYYLEYDIVAAMNKYNAV